MPPAADAALDEAGSLLVEDHHFALVPEWVIDAEVSDAAFRVYAVLLRYGNGSGSRMPSRSLLAGRLHRSVDSVDRAMRELVAAGLVRVEHRRDGRLNLTNRYHVRTSDPRGDRGSRKSAATPSRAPGVGRSGAATPRRTDAATPGRKTPATVAAADVRPDPEKLTERTPHPPPARQQAAPASDRVEEDVAGQLLAECGITDLGALAGRCAAARAAVGRSATRWSAACLLPAIQLAVRHRGWPPALVERALLAVAADPDSRSPMRLAEAGPWWDLVEPLDTAQPDPDELVALDARLAETDGLRPRLQAAARRDLAADGLPVTRAAVLRRACQLLDARPTG